MSVTTMKAKDFMLFVDDGVTPVAGPLTALLCSNEVEVSITTDDEVIECKGDEWKLREMGLHDWSASSGGFVKVGNGVTPKTLFNLQVARTLVKARFSTETSGDFYFEGKAYISQLSQNAGLSGGVSYTVNLVGSGPLTTGDVAP